MINQKQNNALDSENVYNSIILPGVYKMLPKTLLITNKVKAAIAALAGIVIIQA